MVAKKQHASVLQKNNLHYMQLFAILLE